MCSFRDAGRQCHLVRVGATSPTTVHQPGHNCGKSSYEVAVAFIIINEDVLERVLGGYIDRVTKTWCKGLQVYYACSGANYRQTDRLGY